MHETSTPVDKPGPLIEAGLGSLPSLVDLHMVGVKDNNQPNRYNIGSHIAEYTVQVKTEF